MLGVTVTKQGKLIGTPAFMAPEQLMGERLTEKTDQYSFCVALFQGLYGALPFNADNFGALLDQIRQRRVTDVPKRNSVPSSVHRALLRGLSPNPSDRFSSMEALLENLERQRAMPEMSIPASVAWMVVGALTVYLNERGRTGASSSFWRTHTLSLVLVALVLVGLVVALVFRVYRDRRS
jgi:serine/threonine protein kinase